MDHRYLIANANPVHRRWVTELAAELPADVVEDRKALRTACERESYRYVFFPHWSYLIPAGVYENTECVVFHMTDLPFGRGGSPLQNLIVRGHESTQLSALRVGEGLDTGPIYLKAPLSLLGTAREVFLRAGDLISTMIRDIIRMEPHPEPQTGEATVFRRRQPTEGDLSPLNTLKEAYDHIRMLDADGYPPAFVDVGPYRITFTRAGRHADHLLADARITLRDHV